jgi:hypothetical protein
MNIDNELLRCVKSVNTRMLVILYFSVILCADIITQVLVFKISIELKLFIHFSLLHVSAVNYRPSSGNLYIHCTYSYMHFVPVYHEVL